MKPENNRDLAEVEYHYLRGTRPQRRLPFHIRVRRLYWWWPGSERHGKAIDRALVALILLPGLIWAIISFGWLPIMFLVAEIVLIRITVYRVVTGTFLSRK